MADYLIDDELAEEDVLACATRVAETIKNLEGHGEAMSAMASRYADAGQLDFALALVETIEDPYIKDRALAELAVKTRDAGASTEEARQLLKGVEDPGFSASALAQLSIKLAEAGDYDRAVEMATEMDDASSTLAEIAVLSADGGRYDKALEIIRNIEDAPSAVWALTEVAARQLRAGQGTEAANSLSEARALARTIELAKDRAIVLVDMAVKYADAGEQDTAKEILTEAARLAATEEIPIIRESTLTQISNGYARIGETERALALVAEIEDSFQTALTMTLIASEQLRAGRTANALDLLQRARQTVEDEEFYDEGNYPASRYRALAEIGVQYSAAAEYDRAIETAKMIEADKERNEALARIVAELIGSKTNDAALRIARLIEDAYLKTVSLTNLAGAMLKEGEPEQEQALALLSEAEQVAGQIDWPYQKSLALAQLALKYAAAGREREVSQLLLQALETISASESEFYMALALAQLSDAYHETGIETDAAVSNVLREIVIKLD